LRHPCAERRRGEIDGGFALSILGVDVRALGNEHHGDVRLVEHRRHVQQRLTLLVCPFRVAPSIQQLLYAVLVSSFYGFAALLFQIAIQIDVGQRRAEALEGRRGG